MTRSTSPWRTSPTRTSSWGGGSYPPIPSLSINTGFSFTFGSIYNNVVNNRFGFSGWAAASEVAVAVVAGEGSDRREGLIRA